MDITTEYVTILSPLTESDEVVSNTTEDQWFAVSVSLIVIVVLLLISMIILCVFVCRRGLLRTPKQTDKTSWKKKPTSVKSLSFRKRSQYQNTGYESDTVTSEDTVLRQISNTDEEDRRKKTSENLTSREKNPNTESGFESFAGSFMNRTRHENLYEAEVSLHEGAATGSVAAYTSSERRAIFHGVPRRISEEDSYKEENEIQAPDPAMKQLNSTCVINNLPTERIDSMTDEDYENCVEGLHGERKSVLSDNSIEDYEEPPHECYETNNNPDVDYLNVVLESESSTCNLENPIYAAYNEVHREDTQSVYKEHEQVHPDYQNANVIKQEYLQEIKCQKETNVKSFLNLNWEYKSIVDSDGGLLKADNSDICLNLPTKFIQTPATCIYWSIFAQDSEIKAKTDIELCIVSPVVEYYTPYKRNFESYVTIELPHCISEHADDHVQPYWFDPNIKTNYGDFQIRAIPLMNEDQLHSKTLPEVFFMKTKPGFVTIYTLHFSVYFCSCSESFPLELYAVTFGKYVPIDHSQVNIKIKVHIADAKITLKDCIEALKQDEQALGYNFKGKTEIDLDNEISTSDSIEIKVDFEDVPRNMNPVWKHSVDKNGFPIHPVSKQWNIGQRFKCGSHKFIQTTKEWQFKNESPPRYRTVFQCFIEILYRRNSTETSRDEGLYKNVIINEKSLDTSMDFPGLGPYNFESDSVAKEESVPLKSSVHISPQMSTGDATRTRMTVDIDLSDTVIENQITESMNHLDTFSSRRGILPNVMYEIIDGLDDERFDEMCRRLGAERELRMHKRSGDTLSRGKKYDLLDSLRDAMSDGKFCKEIISVLIVMKEDKLRKSISDQIQRAAHHRSQSSINIEPLPCHFPSLRPVQHSDDSSFPWGESDQTDQTHQKTV